MIDEKKVVGLKYEKDEDEAPQVIAKGKGEIAKKIIEIANEHGIYIKEDKSLAEILYTLDLGQEIPEELYGIVAQILMYVYQLEKGR